MKVCIVGIARSGTTALYSLLQQIMLDVHQEVEFIYEPFLWDRNVFNGRYNEVSNRFNYLNSVSIEGIYQHQKLPLFIDDPSEYADNHYLKSIFCSDDHKTNLLAKVIRANGRLSLFQRICPELKIIYILRNPLDSVNSILSLFSYYGGEFHHDDYPRFIKGLRHHFGLNYTAETFSNQIGKELLYWYYMNKFALQTISQFNNEPLIISYENYLSNPDLILHSICDYLHYPQKDEYKLWLRRKDGVVTQKFEISGLELSFVLPYLEKYNHLLKEFGIESSFNVEQTLSKYTVKEDQSFRVKYFYGLNPLLLVDQIEKLKKQKLENERQLAENNKFIIKLKDNYTNSDVHAFEHLKENFRQLLAEKERIEKILQERIRIIDSLQTANNFKQTLLDEIYSSNSWKLGRSLTKLISRILGVLGIYNRKQG